MKPNIVFTGGGTAGHVNPNLALIEALQPEDWQIDYIGSKASVEQGMVQAIQIPFYAISSGKLRRYFSWKNFSDPFKILLGIAQSYRLLRKLKTDLVFSKGGFVAFPVVFAAWLNRIPVVAHESDMTPGLANRLSFPFVNKVCLTFAAAKTHLKATLPVEITGTPIRQALLKGERQAGLTRCGFKSGKPCLMLMGGSQGANNLNHALRDALTTLNEYYQVIHLCGKGNVDSSLNGNPEYVQFEYANEELPDLFAAADLVVSRAGANALYEILALEKPHVLIPLSARVSRGDQIQNARYFNKEGISRVIDDEALTSASLIDAITDVRQNQDEIVEKIKALAILSATSRIVSILKEQLHDGSPAVI